MLSLKSVDFFRSCALAGTGLLILQLVMSLIGTDTDHESDKFKWLFRQALTGFVMMFGWVGLTCDQQFNFSIYITLLLATAAGIVAAVITSLIFRLAKKAHSPGTVFKIEDAVGKEGSVYQRIPSKGSGAGKISISIHGFTHEIDAISFHGEEIASFTQVQVIKQADEKTVVVIPLK